MSSPIAAGIGNRNQQARAHTGLGHAHHTLGNPTQARHHYEHALTLYTDLGQPEADQIRQVARDLGLAGALAGPRRGEELRRTFASSSALVLPSHWEGQPMVILEAMASGLPVVASGISGIPLAVENGRTGLLVPEGEPRRLLEALLELLGDRGQAREMGERGRRKAESELTWDAVAARYREAYLPALSMRV